MVAESGHLGLHELIKRQRVQHVVEFRRALHIEDADGRILACDAPEMQPLTLELQFPRPLVLLGAQLFYPIRIGVVWNPDRHAYVEQHIAGLLKRPRRGCYLSLRATGPARIPKRTAGFVPSP